MTAVTVTAFVYGEWRGTRGLYRARGTVASRTELIYRLTHPDFKFHALRSVRRAGSSGTAADDFTVD